MSWTMINKKNENCPFCGGPAEARIMPEYNRIVFGCFNEKCMFKPKIANINPTISFDEICEIIDKWNNGRANNEAIHDKEKRILDLQNIVKILDSNISRDTNERPLSDLLIHDVNPKCHYYYQVEDVTEAYRVVDIFSDLLCDYDEVDRADILEILYGMRPIYYPYAMYTWDANAVHNIEIVDNRNDEKCFVRIEAPKYVISNVI